MGLEEYKGVYIYAQQVDNKLSDIAFELVGKAKRVSSRFKYRGYCSTSWI